MTFDFIHDTKDIYIGSNFKKQPNTQIVYKSKAKSDDVDEIKAPKIVNKNITQKVIEYRRKNNITQQQFAQKLNIKVDIIKQIENGTLQNPNCNLLNKINNICK